MIVSSPPTATAPRRAHGLWILFALCFLPLGVAYGQERENDRDDGIQSHYRKMGIDDETFGKMMRLLHERGGIEREKLEGVMGGMLRVIHEMKSEGEDFELNQRVETYLRKDLGLTEDQMALVQRIARRLVAIAKGEPRDPDEREGKREGEQERERAAGIRHRIGEVLERFDKDEDGAVTKAEAGEIWSRLSSADADEDGKVTGREMYEAWSRRERDPGERDDGLKGHYRKMGVSGETFDRIIRTLHEEGRVEREKLEGVMGGMLRVIHKMKSEGEDFELDPRLKAYFQKELGLTDDQIALVQGLAQRAAAEIGDD